MLYTNICGGNTNLFALYTLIALYVRKYKVITISILYMDRHQHVDFYKILITTFNISCVHLWGL